jgi:3-oxoisoapionate decarboxylase
MHTDAQSTTPQAARPRTRIGLGTYAFFWQLSDRVSAPLSLEQAIRCTADLGIELFQICDYAPLQAMTDARLDDVAATARAASVTLEIGTKGIRTPHLLRFLDIARRLDATLVRTMLTSPGHSPTPSQAEALLRQALPAYERAGVRIALETYERVPTAELVGVVDRIGNPFLGICSDPANTVAALEQPRAVIEAVAPHVINMHIKDFAFSRKPGWVGFSLSGAPLGDGLLDYDHMVQTIRPAQHDINQIIEHWLPWQGDEAQTIRQEKRWTQHSIDYLRSNQP